MNIRIVAVGLALLFLSSCQQDDVELPKTKKPIFNLHLENYTTDSTFHWAIVSDSKGEILTYSRLENKAIVLESDLADIPDKINITLLNIIQGQKSISYTTTSYLDVTPSDTWKLSKFAGPVLWPIGSADLQVHDFPFSYSNSIISLSAHHGGLSWTGSLSRSVLDLKVTLHEEPTDLLLTVSEFNTGPQYLNIPKAHPNQSYFFENSENFKPADYLLHVSFPENLEVYTRIQGLYENAANYRFLGGHTLSQVENFQGELQEFYLGYLEGYPHYFTEWDLRLSDKSVSLEKIGTPPKEEDFQVLSHDFTVIDQEFSNFAYEVQEDFDYRYSVWQKNETLVDKDHRLYWTVYAPITPEINKVLLKFPEEITQQFPYLENFDPLVYRSSTFVDYLDGKHYEDFLYEQFKKPAGEISERKFYSVYKAK